MGATKTNLEQRALLRPHHRPWPRAGRSTGSEVLRAGEGRPDRRGRWRRRRRAGGRACVRACLQLRAAAFFFFWVDVSGDDGRRKDERSTTNGGEGRICATPPEPSSHERTVGICESAGLAGLKKRVAAVCRSPRLRRTGRVLSPDRSNLNTILPLQVVRTFFFFLQTCYKITGQRDC